MISEKDNGFAVQYFFDLLWHRTASVYAPASFSSHSFLSNVLPVALVETKPASFSTPYPLSMEPVLMELDYLAS